MRRGPCPVILVSVAIYLNNQDTRFPLVVAMQETRRHRANLGLILPHPPLCVCVCVCPPIKGDGERGWGAPPPTSHSKRVRDKSQQYNINFILKNKTQSTGPVPQGT